MTSQYSKCTDGGVRASIIFDMGGDALYHNVRHSVIIRVLKKSFLLLFDKVVLNTEFKLIIFLT